ncbi:hypothetical protein BO79DRAFT_146586 [Aspergillus costaricaensis CBS 115574]|uniref:Uncharacterized protein n=1 Tax=Aspergillus costaricaensis CBS 115574 TaxID=1448317 RepID=A0ACD1IH73_9EURO|nr:hypothetical protein BO79DRAFT_146586 [Aspergillus costaricaensis CBS 115574]RAK89129.1 hypothetical protein BO79DRAFT_146586 [Aspergillus costaricaensis CBS 115574]
MFMPLVHQAFHIHTGSFPRFENVPYLPFIVSATQNTCRYIHIASAIQILSVEDLFVGRIPKTPLPLDSVLLEALLQSLKTLPDQVCWWREALEAGREDAWFSILLLQLPNLRKLELKYLDANSPYLQSILSRLTDPNDPLTGLTQLSELNFSPQMPVDCSYLSSFIPFTQLPSIRKVRLVRAIDNYQLPSTTEEGDATDLLDASSLSPILPLYQSYFHSDLTHLTLHGCSTIATLPSLLTRLPKLKSLIYRHNDSGLPQVNTQVITDHTNQDAGINTSMRQGSPVAQTQHVATSTPIHILNPAELYLGLTEASCNSLQELWVTVERSFRMKEYERRTQDLPGIPIGDLGVFHSLRQVRIRVDNLLTVVRNGGSPQNGLFANVWASNNLWDVLPLSLEGLFLEDCDRGILPVLATQLRQVLESQIGTKEYVLFPLMKTVVLQQPIDEVDRLPFVCPPNIPHYSLEAFQLEYNHRKAENDIQPDIYALLMMLKKGFTTFDLELKVLDKWDRDETFPM